MRDLGKWKIKLLIKIPVGIVIGHLFVYYGVGFAEEEQIDRRLQLDASDIGTCRRVAQNYIFDSIYLKTCNEEMLFVVGLCNCYIHRLFIKCAL